MIAQQDPSGAGNRLGREVRSWAAGLVLAVPVFIGLWFLTGIFHGPLLRPLLTLLAIGPLLAIGWASRSSVWELLVWMGPVVATLAAGLAAPNSLGLAVLTGVAVVWTAGLMLYSSINARVFGWANHVFVWVVDASLPAQQRAAYRAFRGTLKRNVELRHEQEQLEDRPGMIRAFREIGARFQALAAPDSRWKETFNSFALPSVRYADMLEGREPLDYDELNRLMERRDPLLRQLLRDQSLAYRILTFVPRR